MNDGLSNDDKRTLLRLAREAMEAAVRGEEAGRADVGGLSAVLREPGRCFVTLTMNGKLRGCIGGLTADAPLYQEVARRAAQAALRDFRFSPVTYGELAGIEVEVSVLTTPERLRYDTPEELAARVRPGVDGVVLRHGERQATFLPQVWENAPEPERFLSLLCEKLGLKAEDWRHMRLEAAVYQAIKFSEAELGMGPAG
jgi:AmmeMemoRadiSam system protein A